MASMATIEHLAQHMHEVFQIHKAKKGEQTWTWEELEECRREAYRAVATDLLLRPPGWLKKAID